MASTLLRSVSAFSLATKQGDSAGAVGARGGNDISSMPLFSRKKRNTSLVVCSATGEALTGLVFQPFEEVKREEFLVPISRQFSLARQFYVDECEAAINEQINVEYSASYVYHAMFAYFDRDNVALKGLAKFFKESSEEEREHAEKFMKYQNIRGGKVVLHSILNPVSEFEHGDKGDALYAMELALSLEKLTNEKLLSLHKVADKSSDPEMQHFIESEYLEEQVSSKSRYQIMHLKTSIRVFPAKTKLLFSSAGHLFCPRTEDEIENFSKKLVESIKKIAEYVTQLRMVGKGHGVWHFDQMLLHEA